MQLTHYTHEISNIPNILSNGFAWVPNRRELISHLIPIHDFSGREPQQFGMVSFTELAPMYSEEHRSKFGNYGVVVSNAWALDHKVQKVMYVDQSGPVFEALVGLFQTGYKDLVSRIRFPDDAAWQMAYTNRVMAQTVAGSVLWANLLQLYEYLEPLENAYQQEWRIVHPIPYYGYANTTKEVIENVSPSEGWAQVLNVLTVQPVDILEFVCPRGQESRLRNMLPEAYADKPIITVKA